MDSSKQLRRRSVLALLLTFLAGDPGVWADGPADPAELVARSHAIGAAGQHFVELEIRGASARGGANGRPEVHVHVPERPEVPFFVVAEGADILVARACLRGDLPGEVTLVVADKARKFQVDWAKTREDSELIARWREAARTAYLRHRSKGEATAFAAFVLSRLDAVEPGAGASRDFLRAQDRRRSSASTFDLTTGAVAIEESLQLERLRGVGRNRQQRPEVPISTIPGVTVKSHPWSEMIGDRDPAPHAIEKLLPIENYSFEARSFRALVDLSEWMDRYGSPLVQYSEERSDDSGVRERLERQLCLPASALARKIGPYIIDRVAATGSDPFLREGTDFTLIFELKSAELFFANLNKNRVLARTKYPEAEQVSTKYREHAIVGLATSLREVSSYSALVGNYAIVSNSLVGLKRVLDTHDGKIESHAHALERKFMRTQLPRTGTEDAFLYLSDPAIRYLVSPGLKLRESRRLECSASLRSISHATAWRHLRGAKSASGVDELVATKDLPVELLFCPDGGKYRLLDDHREGACSIHGTLEFLTPNIEIDLELVTKEEKAAYDQFRDTYQRYWSRFFDPIGMQVSHREVEGRGDIRRFETVILPLLDMTEYQIVRRLVGGEEFQKGPLEEVVRDTTLLLSAHINRGSGEFQMADGFIRQQTAGMGLRWMGDRISVFVQDLPKDAKPVDLTQGDIFEEMLERMFDGFPGGVRIDVENKIFLAAFLAGVQAWVQQSAPGTVVFEKLPERGGTHIVRCAESDRENADEFFYTVVGDGLYLSFHRPTLESIIDRHTSAKAAGDGEQTEATSEKEPPEEVRGTMLEKTTGTVDSEWLSDTHIALALDLSGSPNWRKMIGALFATMNASKCEKSLRVASLLQSVGLNDHGAWRGLHGAAPICPVGGEFSRDEHGVLRCSHGGGDAATGGPLQSLDAVRASLRFTEEGVRTVVEVEERPR